MTLKLLRVVLLLLLVAVNETRGQMSDEWLKRWQQNADAATATPAVSQAPRQLPAPAKPIPRSWKIAALSIVAITAVLVLALSTRAWRTANVFGRCYRFRPTKAAANRLGAPRCGGHMATVRFRDGLPAGKD